MSRLFRILGKRGRITIPYEIRKRVGFAYNDILSFTESDDGSTVIVKREKVCDNCKETQPVTRDDKTDLYDFLNSLSASEQHDALVHLSLVWAGQQGGMPNGRS